VLQQLLWQQNNRSSKQVRWHLLQELQPLLQPVSQPQAGFAQVLHELQVLHLLWQPPNKPQPLLQQVLQPLLQPLSQPQAGAAPQVGAAAHVGAGAAHVGAGAAQVGAGAAQEGAGAAQLGAAQLGAAAAQPQPLLQLLQELQRLWQRDLQQLLHELVQQLVSQPQPLEPSIRSRSSKLKPEVQAARPSTNDPRSEVRFIERHLLNDGTIELAHVPVRPDYVSAGGRARGRERQRHVGPPSQQSYYREGFYGGANSGRPGV